MAARPGWRRVLGVAASFGGFFAMATAARLTVEVLGGHSPGPAWLTVLLAFASFGGLGGLVALTNAEAPERDPLTVSGWLAAGVIGAFVAFIGAMIVAGASGMADRVNLGWVGTWASVGWILLLAFGKALYVVISRLRTRTQQ